MGTEATPTRPITSPPAPADDPYFYGWRMVPRLDERNRQTWEKVPLTPWDVLHPEEEDFIVNNDAHDRDIHYLKVVFEERVAGRAGVKVLCDHRVLWENAALGAHGPDVVVFENLNKPWNARRGTFSVKEMDARPLVIIEVTSPSTRYIDLDDKVEDYYKAGVPLYIIADRRETNDGGAFIRLLGYRTTPEGYVRIPEDAKGVWIEALKVWIQAEGDRVVCADEHGNSIPDLRERLDAERQRAETAEAARNAEKQRADAAEQKLKEMEAELKRLRDETN
ncbi:MAG: Uma2 family endonuclease [Planctomycetia bacterium]|nr:Uma2 family endonuclease [Planctomycetia bacterium]